MPTSRVVILAALALTALASCGSSDEADKTAAFVGTWTANGNLVATCPAPLNTTNQPIENVPQPITKGTDSDLVIALLMGCNAKLSVSGNVATLAPNQTCSQSVTVMGTTVTAAVTISSGNFTVNGDTAAFSYTGTASVGPFSCTLMGTGTSKKGAAADAGAR